MSDENPDSCETHEPPPNSADDSETFHNRTLYDSAGDHSFGSFEAVPSGDQLISAVATHSTEVADRLDWTADVHYHLRQSRDDPYFSSKGDNFHRLASKIRALDDTEEAAAEVVAESEDRLREGLEFYAEKVDTAD